MGKDLSFLSRIVKSASELIDSDFEVKNKDNKGDLVTNLDFKVEKYLIGEIEREYPDFMIVSEEYNSDVEPKGDYFVIDPIDGTINFANGLPLWGIQIACVRGGEVSAAVIYLPVLGELYAADEGGAFLNGQGISVNEFDVDRGVCDIEGTDKTKFQIKARGVFRHMRDYNSTAVVFAWVAAGRLSMAGYIGQDKPWDYIPGRFIVERAGGVTYDKGGVHLVANKKECLEELKQVVGIRKLD